MQNINKHDLSNHSLYKKWYSMKTRCFNKKCQSYKNYGGRGITICERWLKFQNFYEDMSPTFIQGLSLERINNDGNYEPNNCKWIPMAEQQKNKRSYARLVPRIRIKCLNNKNKKVKISVYRPKVYKTYEYAGLQKTLTEWAELLNCSIKELNLRIKNGWTIEEAFEIPSFVTNACKKNFLSLARGPTPIASPKMVGLGNY